MKTRARLIINYALVPLLTAVVLVVPPAAFGQAPGTLLWTFPAPFAYGSPAVGFDGTIYAGSRDGHLYAVTSQGSNVWRFQAGGEIDSSPAVAEDGAIYFGCEDGKLYALNPDGTLRWTWGLTYPGAHGIRSSPAIAMDGTLYIGFNNSLHAITPSGTRLWEFVLEGDSDGSPAIARDGTIYMLSRKLYAVRPDGSKRWEFPAGHQTAYYNWQDSVAIADDGAIYFVGNSVLYALGAFGMERWRSSVSSLGRTPAIGPNRTVFAILSPSDGGGTLHAFTWDGLPQWAIGAPYRYDESPSPSVDRSGIAYFAGVPLGTQGYLHCALNPDGTTNWLFRSRNFIFSGLKSPATIGPFGRIYVWGNEGLYAFAGSNPAPPTGWPMHRQNARQTGKVEWPRIRNLACQTGHAQIEVFADPGWNCTVQASSNLLDWSTVTNFVSITNRNFVSEAITPAMDQRFYRVISPSR